VAWTLYPSIQSLQMAPHLASRMSVPHAICLLN